MNSRLIGRGRLVAGAVSAVLLIAGLLALVLLTDAAAPDEAGPAAVAPLAGPIDDGLVRRELAPNEVPAEEHGLLFVDIATGTGELWTYADSGNAWVDYFTDPGHRWLLARRYAPDSNEWIVADRATGESYRLNTRDNGWMPVEGGRPTSRLLLPTTAGLLVVESLSQPGHHAVVNLESDPTGIALEFVLPESDHSEPPVLLRNEEQAVIAQSLVNLKTGNVSPLVNLEGLIARTPIDDGGWLDVATVNARLERPDEVATLVVRRFDSSGDLRNEVSLPAGFQPAMGFGQQPSPEGVQVSPDGRWLAWQGSLPSRAPPETEIWPVVVLADLEGGEVTLRVVRASLRVRAGAQQWLSDSSGLVLDEPHGPALLRPLLAELENLQAEGAPLIAPHDPSVLVYRGEMFDLTGPTDGPGIPAVTWLGWEPRDEYGLDLSGRELRIERSVAGGRDWTILVLSPVGLPARLEKPPFDDEIRLRVATGDSSGLNLRQSPGVGGTLIDTLSNDTLLTVTTAANLPFSSALEEGATHEPFYEAPWWLHVRTPDGLEGWVRSEYLAWAD